MKQMNSNQWRWFLKTILFSSCILFSSITKADEGGVSFWIPGFYGSLAAAPLQPGFAFTSLYYHPQISAGEEVAFARQVSAARIKSKFTGNADMRLDASADLLFLIPSYTFERTLFKGQANIALALPYGRSKANVNSTISGTFGLSRGFTFGRARSDEVVGISDFATLFNLRWNFGVHNLMTYIVGNIPVGVYDPNNLTNLGLNHESIDSGGGYTYFNKTTGREFSAVVGFTYNFPNSSTQYQNGIDAHMDWSASQFLNKKIQFGAVGYGYQQLSCDSGDGAHMGCFKSHVTSVGPQIGYIIPGKTHQAYINLKGYKEFEANHRAHGWNAWLTLSISPAANA